MAEVNIEELVASLTNREVAEIVIEKKDFMKFVAVWSNHSLKSQIVGEAQHSGNVIYRFIENNESESIK